jgi:glycerol-3-phosphate dehydrogenase (NAD(P)+)
MSERFDIAVLGAGAWGTALAILLAKEGKRVALWARDAGVAAQLRTARENPRLPGVRLPENLAIITAFPEAEMLLLAVPIQHARIVLAALPSQTTPLVLCCKGLEAGSLLLPQELAAALQPQMPAAMLTGPNFAHEIAAGLPAAAVLAAEDAVLRARLMRDLHSASLRLYAARTSSARHLGARSRTSSRLPPAW